MDLGYIWIMFGCMVVSLNWRNQKEGQAQREQREGVEIRIDDFLYRKYSSLEPALNFDILKNLELLFLKLINTNLYSCFLR